MKALVEIKEVFSELEPTRVEVLEMKNKSFVVRVVTNKFEGITYLNRFDILSELIDDLAEENCWTIAFEAWTEKEFLELIKDGWIKNAV